MIFVSTEQSDFCPPSHSSVDVLQSHNSHDVVLLCTECHRYCEIVVDEVMRKTLLGEMRAAHGHDLSSSSGAGTEKQDDYQSIRNVSSWSRALSNPKVRLPDEKLHQYRRAIIEYLQVEPMPKNFIDDNRLDHQQYQSNGEISAHELLWCTRASERYKSGRVAPDDPPTNDDDVRVTPPAFDSSIPTNDLNIFGRVIRFHCAAVCHEERERCSINHLHLDTQRDALIQCLQQQRQIRREWKRHKLEEQQQQSIDAVHDDDTDDLDMIADGEMNSTVIPLYYFCWRWRHAFVTTMKPQKLSELWQLHHVRPNDHRRLTEELKLARVTDSY